MVRETGVQFQVESCQRLEMPLDTSLLSTLHHKGRINGKVEQSRKMSSASLHLGVVTTEKAAFGSPSTTVANFTF